VDRPALDQWSGEHSASPQGLLLRAQFDITPSYFYDGDMHRTTINLDEAVYLRCKRLAERRGRSLARTIEDLLRAALHHGPVRPPPPVPLHAGIGPCPGVDIADRDRLYDLMEKR